VSKHRSAFDWLTREWDTPPELTVREARLLGLRPLPMPDLWKRFRRDPTHKFNFLDDVSWWFGTAQVWNSSGGTSTTPFLITGTSLAAGAARQGAKNVAGWSQTPTGLANPVRPDLLQADFKVQWTSAPTAGDEAVLYLGFSDSATVGTDNPGGLTGVDGTVANIDVLPQLTLVGAVAASVSIGTGVQAKYDLMCPCVDNYCSPVVYNHGTPAFDATAAHTNISVQPLFRARAN
jgi:hypothetical protein